MSDKQSEQTYKRQNSRVYGNGMSINCTNIVTAENLQNTLNNYEKLKQQITALQMDLKVVQNDLDKIKELLK